MITFTRMLLNPSTRSGRKLLLNPQAMHAAVRAAFPSDLDEEGVGRILWRVDSMGHGHVLYIVAPEPPVLGHLHEQCGWPTRPAQTADYGPLLDSLQRGQEWRFRLRANPVKSVKGVAGRGVVRPLAGAAAQVEWLRTRAEQHGFEVPQALDDEPASVLATVTDRSDLAFARVDRRTSQPGRVSIRAVQFDGLLRVTDVDALRGALLRGIGRGKAYGCGLLTLQRQRG